MPKLRCVQCKEQFHTEQQADDELTARIVLIDALLAQGKQAKLKKKWKQLNRLEKRARTAFFACSSNWSQAASFWSLDQPDAAGPLLRGVTATHNVTDLPASEFADRACVS